VAEITQRRRQGELIRGVFGILLDAPEGLAAAAVLRELEKRIPPTPFEASTYPSRPNTRRYEKFVRFSTIGPVKAGWLVKERGTWTLTEDGRAALTKYPDPDQFQAEANRLYRVWRREQPAAEEPEAEAPAATAGSLEEAEEAAWAEIREYVGTMPPYDFQELVAALLKAMGYHVAWVAPPGPDQGIDIIAHSDPLGTTGPRIKVQVKRHAETKVNADGLRSFMAVLGQEDVGIFVSVAGFTSEAEREARTQERRRITLLDLDHLVELWIAHFDRLEYEARQLLPLRPIYFLAPNA
jgi:restriction system protein